MRDIYINLEGNFGIKDNFFSLLSMENNCCTSARSPTGNWFSIRRYQKDDYPGMVFLSVEHGLILQNLVPLPIIVKLIEGPDKATHKSLRPNETQIINQVMDLQNLKISVMLPGSFWSKEETLLLNLRILGKEESKITFGKNYVRTLSVQDSDLFMVPIKLTCQKSKPNHIFLSVDHILVDKIPVSEFTYFQEVRKNDKIISVPVKIGQRGILKTHSKKDCNIFVIDATFPLTLSKPGVLFELGKTIDLSSIEGFREIILEYKKDPSSDEIISFPITLQVSENLLSNF